MFALRRFSARSCKAASLLPSAQLQQASIAPRALSSIATCSKIARTPAPSVLSAIQRRNFTEDGDRRPSYGGGGNYGSNYGSNYGGGGNRGGRSFDSHRSPEGRPLKPTNVLYVGNLQFDVTEELLKGHFEGMGELAGVRVITDPQGMSKGFGYIEFADLNSAIKACEELNNSVFAGRRLNVQYLAKPKDNRMSPNPPSKTLFIGNMNYEMSDDDINKLFKDIQNCLDVRVAMDRRTGQPRGFAHADFSSVDAAIKAKEQLEGREFFGRTLRVDYSARQRDDAGNLLPSENGGRENNN